MVARLMHKQTRSEVSKMESMEESGREKKRKKSSPTQEVATNWAMNVSKNQHTFNHQISCALLHRL